MKVTGFTFIRNAIKFDYPIIEAITSILPICDEFIVVVANSEDNTTDLIQSIRTNKIKIIPSIWDESLREGGRVLADETNKAYREISADTDWAFYIQGDECAHEKDLPIIKQAMHDNLNNYTVEGFLFKYHHFYGSYDFIGNSRRWYRNEIRVVRNLPNIESYKDAQGFRIDGRKLKVKPIDAHIHHYGWVKDPRKQQEKAKTFNKLWHSDEWVNNNIPDISEFDYAKIDSLKRFEGTHPKVMQERINKMNWQFNFDPTKKKLSFKNKILQSIESISGWRIGEYKNYTIIK